MKRMKPEEVFEYLDEKWKWIAMDEDCQWYGHHEKPTIEENFYWVDDSGQNVEINISIDYDGPCEESLFERPKPKVIYFTHEGTCNLHFYNKECHKKFGAINECQEVPPEVAAWFHKIMEDER